MRTPSTSIENGVPDDTNNDGVITYGYGSADFSQNDIWIGDRIPLSPEETGRQDTILVPPGWMVSIAVEFDLPGEYVWHCHILSHEDHEMMRPFEVVDPAVIVFQQMYGFPPSDPQLDNLHAFQQAQLNYALSIGATDPALYLYEVLARISHAIFAQLSRVARGLTGFFKGVLARVVRRTRAELGFFLSRGERQRVVSERVVSVGRGMMPRL